MYVQRSTQTNADARSVCSSKLVSLLQVPLSHFSHAILFPTASKNIRGNIAVDVDDSDDVCGVTRKKLT